MSFGSSLHCKILKCNMLKFLKDQVLPTDFRVAVLFDSKSVLVLYVF